jgi:hypothetical protein
MRGCFGYCPLVPCSAALTVDAARPIRRPCGLARAGLNPENVMVCFKETSWENWAFGGGRLIHT